MTATITCPDCGVTSYHPTDVAEGYCGRCHDWTSKGGRPMATMFFDVDLESEVTDHVCTRIRSADDVTEELLDIVRWVVKRHYQPRAGFMDMVKVMDRIEDHVLRDGTYPDLGDDMASPAMDKITEFALRVRCGLINV
jgi:hypothetical protein